MLGTLGLHVSIYSGCQVGEKGRAADNGINGSEGEGVNDSFIARLGDRMATNAADNRRIAHMFVHAQEHGTGWVSVSMRGGISFLRTFRDCTNADLGWLALC